MPHPTTTSSSLAVDRPFGFWTLSLALGCSILQSTRAEVVTFEFTGTANYVGSALSSYFQTGDPYTLTLSYDTTTLDTGFGKNGSYSLLSASMVIQATGGTWSANLNGDNNSQVQIENHFSYDRFQVSHTSFSQPEVAGETALSWVLTMYTEANETFAAPPCPPRWNGRTGPPIRPARASISISTDSAAPTTCALAWPPSPPSTSPRPTPCSPVSSPTAGAKAPRQRHRGPPLAQAGRRPRQRRFDGDPRGALCLGQGRARRPRQSPRVEP